MIKLKENIEESYYMNLFESFIFNFIKNYTLLFCQPIYFMIVFIFSIKKHYLKAIQRLNSLSIIFNFKILINFSII